MEYAFLSGLSEATRQTEVYHQLAGNLMSGILFVLFSVLTARYIFRAWLYSYIGKKNGAFVSALIEASTMLAYAVSAWENPAIIVGTLVWGAVIFNAIIYGL